MCVLQSAVFVVLLRTLLPTKRATLAYRQPSPPPDQVILRELVGMLSVCVRALWGVVCAGMLDEVRTGRRKSSVKQRANQPFRNGTRPTSPAANECVYRYHLYWRVLARTQFKTGLWAQDETHTPLYSREHKYFCSQLRGVTTTGCDSRGLFTTFTSRWMAVDRLRVFDCAYLVQWSIMCVLQSAVFVVLLRTLLPTKRATLAYRQPSPPPDQVILRELVGMWVYVSEHYEVWSAPECWTRSAPDGGSPALSSELISRFATVLDQLHPPPMSVSTGITCTDES